MLVKFFVEIFLRPKIFALTKKIAQNFMNCLSENGIQSIVGIMGNTTAATSLPYTKAAKPQIGLDMFKMIAVTVVLALSVFLLTGCNTVNGFGKDLQSWTADESHGHNMAQQYRQRQLNNDYRTNNQYNR